MVRKLLDAQSIAVRIDPKVLPLDKAGLLQLVIKRDVERLIAWTKVQGADAIDPTNLLPARSQWNERRAAKKNDEFAPLHDQPKLRRWQLSGSNRYVKGVAAGCGQYLSWVNRVVLATGQPLPVYPDQQTSLDRPGWSGSCQKR
jgi:hypothetical protein